MNEYTLSFTISADSAEFVNNGKRSIEYRVGDNLSISLWYSFNENPLVLTANAEIGDKVELSLTSAHIVLYVNDNLCDEEWCCGEIGLDNLSCDNTEFTLSEGVREFILPQRQGLKADELRIKGVNIGDCMPFSDPDSDRSYHLYWLYDRHHHRSKWGLGAHQWAHAATNDLVNWNEYPMAVPVTEQTEGSICTGSVICDGGKYYAWYAVRMSDRSPARLTSSVSDNGSDYVKSGKYFILPERYHRSSARDPKVIKFNGKFHMLVTTTLLSSGNGCLAHLVSEHADMSGFDDLGPIIEWSSGEQPECPDYFEMGGYYYLIWSIGGKAHYAYSAEPFGKNGWTIPENNLLDCGSVPKSAVCPWNGERVFSGFIPEGGYAGSLIMKKAVRLEDGRLELSEI